MLNIVLDSQGREIDNRPLDDAEWSLPLKAMLSTGGAGPVNGKVKHLWSGEKHILWLHELLGLINFSVGQPQLPSHLA